MRPVLAIIVAVIIVIVAVIGYAVAGYAYSQSRLNSARNAYNTVVGHENKLTDAVNSLGTKLTGANVVNAQDCATKTGDLTANYPDDADDLCRHKDLAYAANLQ